MYEEELIFGPFTFTQFTYFAACVAVGVLALYLVEGLFAVIALVVATGVGIKLALDHAPTKVAVEELPVYLEQKRRTLGDVVYKTWLQKMVAQHQVHKDVRAERGDDPDTELEAVLVILKTEQQKEGER